MQDKPSVPSEVKIRVEFLAPSGREKSKYITVIPGAEELYLTGTFHESTMRKSRTWLFMVSREAETGFESVWKSPQ
jgi:hypothetical protein